VSAYSSVPVLFSVALALSSGPASLTGVVVDRAGQPLPRAHVRVTTGSTSASTFSASDGTFRVDADALSGCTAEASLEGFTTATADCASGQVRLTLDVAPVAEHIVVSATRTDAPASQVATSATVFDRADLERRQFPMLGDLLRAAPGTTVVATGAPGGVTSLFVRGGESNYTKVLLDGVPLNEPGGAFNLNDVTTENLERVELFDVFRGKNIPAGQKSVAYAFTYRDAEKTLTDAEVNATHEKLVAHFKEKIGAVVRES